MKNKIFKLISIVLSIAIVLSVCTMAFTTTVGAVSPTYYIDDVNGNDTNAGGEDAPLQSIKGAIEKAKDAGCGAEDIVTVHIKRNSAVPKFEIGGTEPISLPEHNFTLKLTSVPGASGTSKQGLLGNQNVILGGPVIFENVRFSSSSAKNIYTNGNDIDFCGNITTNNYTRICIGSTSTTEFTDDINVSFKNLESAISSFYFCLGNEKQARTFSGDINIIYDSPLVDGNIYLGGADNSTNYTTTYAGNININLKASKSNFTLNRRSTKAAVAFTEDAALQIKNSSGNPISYGANLPEATVTDANYYYLTLASADEEKLQFTDTAGKFAITEGYIASAQPTDAGGVALDKAPTVSENGYLTLDTKGYYTVTFTEIQKEPTDFTFYVSATGNDDNSGLDADNALATIEAAINKVVNAGYNFENQVVTLYIKRGDGTTVPFGTTSTVALPEYKFTVKILTDPDDTTKANIGGQNVVLGGPTIFENIAFAGNSATNIYLNNNKVEFLNDVSSTAYYRFPIGDNTTTTEITKDISINFKDVGSISNFALGNQKSSRTFSGTINVGYDSSKADGTLYLGVAENSGGYTTTYNGNVNLALKSTKTKFTLNRRQTAQTIKFGEDAAFQIINSSGKDIVYGASLTEDVISQAGNYYFINVDLAMADAIGFTETAGEFAVDTEMYIVKAQRTDADGIALEEESIVAQNGLLTLSEKGYYNITFDIAPKAVTYYVAYNGDDSNNGSDEQNAFATIGGAIAYATKKGYKSEYTVNLKIVKNANNDVAWGPIGDDGWVSIPEHDFKVYVSSTGNITDIGGQNVVLGGPMYFENVYFKAPSAQTVAFNGNDIVFGDKVNVNAYYRFVAGDASTTIECNKDINIHFTNVANSEFKLYLANLKNGRTFSGDMNVTFDSPNSRSDIYLGTIDGGNTTYNGNVNLNVKSSNTDFTFKRNNANRGVTFADGKALQVINSSGNNIAYNSNISEEVIAQAGDYYFITNKTGNVNAISFTENAGTYNIDLGEIKFEGYYAVFTNDKTGEIIKADGDSVTLTPGKYTVTTDRDRKVTSYHVEEGTTLAEAVQKAIDEKHNYGDEVTLNLGSIEEINIGALPEYNFNLVIKSDVKTRLVMNESKTIANNQGAHTHFKNVEIYSSSSWNTINLMGSSVTFDKDVLITTGGNNTLSFGTSRDTSSSKAVVDGKQTVVIDCVAPSFISMSSWAYANRTYNDDVTLVINNSKTNTTVWFNASSNSAVNGTTEYLGNVNINIKDAASVKFNYLESTSVAGDIQFLVDGNTTVNEEQINTVNNLTSNEMYYIIDNTFQRGVLEFTDEVGVYELTTDYEATATCVRTYDVDSQSMVDVIDGATVNSIDGKVAVYNKKIADKNYTNVWEIRTNEYFEDFNDISFDELHEDWVFSSDKDSTIGETQITQDGKLSIVSKGNIKEIKALNKNLNIQSKEQYISFDLKGKDFGESGGIEILARLGNEYEMDAYSMQISGSFVTIKKLDGNSQNKTSSGFYSYNNNGFDMDGLWGRLPGGVNKDSNITYNYDHTYRISFSVTTDYANNGNEVAFVRGIVLNLNTNTIMFDEIFKDTDPYTLGTEFAICSPKTSNTNPEVYIDNLYFSTEKFRDGDEGCLEGDINGDGVFDIRDLVYAQENESENDSILICKADKDVSGNIDEGDYLIIRKEILGIIKTDGEFDYTGASDSVAANLHDQIMDSTSALNGKVYTATNNGEVVLNYTITGNIWYVSEFADGSGDGKSTSKPWTLKQLQDNTIIDRSNELSNYFTKKVKDGDAVLFERGSVFRTDNFLKDCTTQDRPYDAYAYMFMNEGTFYGAYGEGEKPKFISSLKNYADVEWVEVEGQENLYVINAPEIIIDMQNDERVGNGLYATDNSATGIIIDNGEIIGQRRSFPTSAKTDKLYTLYKDGHFTYDESTGNLYLYSSNGNPGDIYESIEVSRAIQGIQVNSHESNVKIDNLAFIGFGRGAIGSSYETDSLSVTNCEIGYSGGVFIDGIRQGNAVGLYCGGSDVKVNHNWIYQTWDTAISPQGNTGGNYSGFEVIGNLLEYNNADIEIFDHGDSHKENISDNVESFTDSTNEAKWNECKWTNNIIRFTTLGWGSREVDKIRGIQGVIRGSLGDAFSADIDWANNIIDSPGMEIAIFDNSTAHTDVYTAKRDGEGNIITGENGKYTYAVSSTITEIFKFGSSYNTSNDSILGSNRYYLNPYIRNKTTVIRQYMTAVPSDYEAQNGVVEDTNRSAKTATDFYNSMIAFDNASTSKIYWGRNQIVSTN